LVNRDATAIRIRSFSAAIKKGRGERKAKREL
jgi:hypothetical protein